MSEIITHYKNEIKASVRAAKSFLNHNRKFVKASDYFIFDLEDKIKKIDPEALIDIPPKHIKADIAISGLRGGKTDTLARKISKLKDVEDVKRAGVFLNINLKKDIVYKNVLKIIQGLGDQYGESDFQKNKVALIEYSSPNITKPIGVGHLRSTIIGQTLSNIYEQVGYGVIRENYLGDWGTQFGKVIYGYQHWANKKKLKENPIRELKNVYVRFTAEAEKDPTLKEKAREIFRKLEGGDEKLLGLWKYFRDLSIEKYKKIYNRLGVRFDVYSGEGFSSDRSGKIIEQCLKSGVCRTDSQSKAVIVDSLADVPSFLLRKSDGTTLYHSRDLAMMEFRIKEYKPNVIIYVVGEEQALYFRQLKKIGRALGILNNNICLEHVDFGAILVDGKKMATRRGTVIELEDLIEQSVKKAGAIVKKKNPALAGAAVKKISEIVGVGAIIYNDLKQSRRTGISFNWEKMLNFEQGSAAYLQYTYVRIRSIIKKIDKDVPRGLKPIFSDEIEFNLAKKLLFFPKIIFLAQQQNAPHLIATYLEELAQLFNSFYNAVSILKTKDEDLQLSRLLLIRSVSQVIKNGLNILNIGIPEQM